MSFSSPSAAQAKILWTAVTALALAVLVGLVGLLLFGLGWVIDRLSPVLLPLAAAGILAYLLDPLVDFFERKQVPRGRAIWLVFLAAVLVFAGIMGSIVPRLVIETQRLIDQRDVYAERLRDRLERFFEHPPFQIHFPEHWNIFHRNSSSILTNAPVETPAQNSATNAAPFSGAPSRPVLSNEFGKSVLSWTTAALPKIGRWLLAQLSKVASWFGLLAGLALVPVYTFYFLLEKRGISENWTDYLPMRESAWKDETVFVIRAINNYLILFFRGQVLVALCDGLLLTIGFLLLGLDFAILLGLMAGLLSIVPYLGIVVSLVPALILAAVQFGDWLHPALVLLVFASVQTAEGLLISPKIMGDRVGLHPLTIIVAVMVGTTLMGGIIGGILAIPLTAALRVLMFRYVWRKRAAAVPEA